MTSELTAAAERLVAGIEKAETFDGPHYWRIDDPTKFGLMEPYELAAAYLAERDDTPVMWRAIFDDEDPETVHLFAEEGLARLMLGHESGRVAKVKLVELKED